MLLLVCFVLLLSSVTPGSNNLVPVVPYPQEVEFVSASRRVLNRGEFRIVTTQPELESDKVVVSSARRYEHYFKAFKQFPASSDGYITEVLVTVKDTTSQLHIGVNEGYSLNTVNSVVELSADTRFGVVRGLETFYQLYNATDGTFPSVHITDYPRFAYRGLLIDTSRHFLSVESIKKVISAMSMSKLNVLHWHIVDDPSFPYFSTTFPSLSGKGAYDENHVYHVSDVVDVIGFAEDHGIVVVPEFDTPGHTLSWGKSIPNFLTYCPGKGTFGGDYGPIDPSVESNYEVLLRLFTEVTALFSSKFVHLGGDEVPFKCWEANSNLTQWMESKGIKTYPELENYYEDRLLDIIESLNHSYVVWEEIFNNGLKIRQDTIIHVWKGGWQKTMSNVVKGGYRAILSSPWYLDYISKTMDWKGYYHVEPLDITGTAEEKSRVIGGEACIWGEYVDNTNILSRTFPRASAVAERLWSDVKVRDVKDMQVRLHGHRCGMVARGIPAEDVSTRNFCPVEFSGYDW